MTRVLVVAVRKQRIVTVLKQGTINKRNLKTDMNYDDVTPKQRALMWAESIAEHADRMTTGNYMHSKNHIAAGCNTIMSLFDNEKIQRACRCIRNQCTYMTSGNLSHNVACIKTQARILKQRIEELV